LEQFHNPSLDPIVYWEEALKRDPENSQVNTALGRRYLGRGLFAKAEACLRLGLKRQSDNYTHPESGEIQYYLGLACRARGKTREAAGHFSRAAWSFAWSSASYYHLAEMACLEKDFERAMTYLDRCLETNSRHSRGGVLKAVLLRKTGELQRAGELAAKIADRDVLDFWSRNENVLCLKERGRESRAEQNLEELMDLMHGNVQSYLELALDYSNCGLWKEARDVLVRYAELPETEQNPHPLVEYFLAYFSERMGRIPDSKRHLDKAKESSLIGCFPFRLETMLMLEWAQERDPSDGRAAFLRGNLLFDLQPEQAVRDWERAARLERDFFLIHRNLGLAYARIKNDLPGALDSMERALSLCRTEPRLYYELDLLYEAAGMPLEKRLDVLERNHDTVKLRDDSLSREIQLLVQTGRYSRAIELLKNHHFHVWEGGGRIHGVYVDAHLLQGLTFLEKKDFKRALEHFRLALEYPENLEVGRPENGGQAIKIHYLIAGALKALDRDNEADKHLRKSLSFEAGSSELRWFRAMSLRSNGEEESARKIFQDLATAARDRLTSSPIRDFFEKFGEKQSLDKRRAQSHYILGLGLAAMGKQGEAGREWKRALKLYPGHVWARRMLSHPKITQ
jgi:tetratricopeptide (TPR) repeat protein